MSELGPVPLPSPTALTAPKRASFYGTTTHRVADKTNQVAIPKVFKRIIDESQESHLVLIQYLEEPFLRLYTKDTFDQKMIDVKRNPELTTEQQDEEVNRLAGAAQMVEPDGQGRFVLPKEFAEKLQQSEVAFQGAFTFIKIWPAEMHLAGKSGAQPVGAVGHVIKGILNR